MKKREKEFIVRILKAEWVAHDVRRFKVEKPDGFSFTPGQATDVSINKSEWISKKNPFTFTSLASDPNLEFTIKIYKERKGVTNALGSLKIGDELIIREPFGAIHYKGPGVFIAGGAGITPFIAILRQLQKENKLEGNTLIFSNKTEKDIILKSEFDRMKGLDVIYTLTRESNEKYEDEHIDQRFLQDHISDFTQNFYICGPIRLVGEVQHILRKLGAQSEAIVVET